MELTRSRSLLVGLLLVCACVMEVGAKPGLPRSSCRAHSASITEFGGVGDGTTVNTKAFKDAVDHLSEYSDKGGGLLYIPPGKWLTGSFNLTSNFTLYLDRNAVILGSQDLEDWPLIPPLPSYGRGRDGPGPRYSSLINGHNLTDVVITDSCSYVRIEDCYVSTGDDIVAIKSGWDEYGIAYGKPSEHIVIRRLVGVSPTSAVIALGSEMSGGIQDVWAEDIRAINSETGIRIKTSVGRGGFVRDINVNGMTMVNMRWAFGMTGSYGSHPDGKYNPNALPVVERIRFSNVVATNVSTAGKLEGIRKAPFRDICLTNVTIAMANSKHKQAPWTCTDVRGSSYSVSPEPCNLLQDPISEGDASCSPSYKPKTIDLNNFKVCSYTRPHH